MLDSYHLTNESGRKCEFCRKRSSAPCETQKQAKTCPRNTFRIVGHFNALFLSCAFIILLILFLSNRAKGQQLEADFGSGFNVFQVDTIQGATQNSWSTNMAIRFFSRAPETDYWFMTGGLGFHNVFQPMDQHVYRFLNVYGDIGFKDAENSLFFWSVVRVGYMFEITGQKTNSITVGTALKVIPLREIGGSKFSLWAEGFLGGTTTSVFNNYSRPSFFMNASIGASYRLFGRNLKANPFFDPYNR